MIVVFPGTFPFTTTSCAETTIASAIVGSDTETRVVSSGNCSNSPRPAVIVIEVLGRGVARGSTCCEVIVETAQRIITTTAVMTLFISAFPQSPCRPGRSGSHEHLHPPSLSLEEAEALEA